MFSSLCASYRVQDSTPNIADTTSLSTHLVGVPAQQDARLEDGEEGVRRDLCLVEAGEPVGQVLLHGVQVLVVGLEAS